MAFTLKQLDLALYNEATGLSLTIGGEPVTVFVGMPNTNVSGDRVFPSISFDLVDLRVDRRRLESQVDPYIESYDYVSATPTLTISPEPEPYVARYNLHVWSRKIEDDRDFAYSIANFLINDSLLVGSDSAVETNYVYMLKFDMVTLDEFIDDQQTYHKAWPLDIYFEMQPTKAKTVPAVTSLQLQFYGVDGDNITFVERYGSTDGTTVTKYDTEI